ncbi:putative type VI secretion system effector [Ralstonia sp. ASV6]|uniref:putative type VI secretion system effector n=1 Tax=Ralstonia sp. ASV6 TaxID=2795124 RepID=UPI0018ED650A|nr:putative type VI secretion system effector [Ralstonia sp. ASV6]
MNIEQRSEGLVKLTGTIENYRVTREEASFVFTDTDRTKLGVTAIAAGIAGLSGPAIATAANAASAEEHADYVEFDLDGKPIKGWVWRSPFNNGDDVEVAAEWREDHYETAGIARPIDRIIALYPHCSRGKARHIKNAVKWWLIGVTLFLVGAGGPVLGIMLASVESPRDLLADVFPNGLLAMSMCFYGFFGLMTLSLARKWMPFVRLTERVCSTLGIPDAGNVDLVKSSKAQRKPDDAGEYGTFYFRY